MKSSANPADFSPVSPLGSMNELRQAMDEQKVSQIVELEHLSRSIMTTVY
jgi:hypothetical protein